MWLRKLAGAAVTALNQASRGAGILAIAFLMAMLVLTVADVFLRYFFNAPIPGSVELTKYFMVGAGFLGLAWCALKGGHIKVDLLINRLPPRYQVTIDSINLLLALTVVPLVAWQGFTQAKYALLEKTTSRFLAIPDYPFYIVVGLGFVLLFLVMVYLVIGLIKKSNK